jgi:RNA-directed DNA polymerase
MATLRRLTALAIGRAMLAGPPNESGIAARLGHCTGSRGATWQLELARRCARLSIEHWRRLTARSLADLIEGDAGFIQAWASADRPQARNYFVAAEPRMQPLPLGLHECRIPHWANSAELARGLHISTAGLWRLTRSANWWRRSPLVEQHYRYRMLPKRSGGWRLLEVPEPYLMHLQRRVLHELLDHVTPHEAACGYTQGRSLLDHVRAHAAQTVILKFDLRDFFASVRASRVHGLFATLGYPASVARELTALCTTATPEPILQRMREEGGIGWEQAQRWRDAHLPQGAPTSAALANLCAFRFDLRLDGLAHVLGARYTRYADDITLSGPRGLHNSAARIERWIGRIALEEGFALNHRKTRCQPSGGRQTVCNVVVNQRPNLRREEFDRLKAVLHRCATRGPAGENRHGVPDWRQHLQGRIAWAAQLNPQKAQRLRRLWDRIDWSR